MRNRIFNIQPIVTPFKKCQSNEQNLYKIRQKDTPLKDSGQGYCYQLAVAHPDGSRLSIMQIRIDTR